MCDNKNEIHKIECDKPRDNTSIRLDLDITEKTDSYPEFDFLDLLRNLKIREKKLQHKSNSEEVSSKSNPFSEEDSDVEVLAKFYEEKYGTCNDYAKLGEGYDEEDSFIDNSAAINDLVPSGIQTEFGGFYINRGKLNFVKDENSSSSTSEDVDKFLAHNRLNAKRLIISDDENDEKESCKAQSNNHRYSNTAINSNASSINSSNNAYNSQNLSNNNNTVNNAGFHSSVIKSRKKSGEYQHKSKKIRKTATPKIPEHLLNKKPFPGSIEYRKNINEFKKNRLKVVNSDKKSSVTNLIVNSSSNVNDTDNSKIIYNHSGGNSVSTVNGSCKNNFSEDDNKESYVAKKKSGTTKESHKDVDGATQVIEAVATGADVSNKVPFARDGALEAIEAVATGADVINKQCSSARDGAAEVIEAVATGADLTDKQSASGSDSSDSSSSDSDSDLSEDTSSEQEKTPNKAAEEVIRKPAVTNGSIVKDNTAKSNAHLCDRFKDLIAQILEISLEEKNKFSNLKINSFLLSLDERLRESSMPDKNNMLDYVAELLKTKKDNIIKKIKKLRVLQEEKKMSTPLRKLKESVNAMMPLVESNYFNEYTKAAGTSPQIYAELSRYYWSIDPGSLPQRKFPWTDQLRQYLRDVVQHKKNCFFILRPRKESLIDYIKLFLEVKVKPFWPKEWMTVDILLEEAQITTAPRQKEEKHKNITKVLSSQNPSNVAQKKISSQVPTSDSVSRKQISDSSPTSRTVPSSSVKPVTVHKSGSAVKNPEVKSILIPRKTPSGSGHAGSAQSKANVSSMSSLNQSLSGSRLQVTLNRLNVQEYLDRISGSQTSISRNSGQQISPNRVQQSVSPNKLVKTSSPNSVLSSTTVRTNVAKQNTSTSNVNKTLASSKNCHNPQSVLKTIEIHSNPVIGSKTSPNTVTISPVNESIFKDLTPSSEVLNLTKSSSFFTPKGKDYSEPKTGRSNSPSLGIPLPSGITISPTNASPSTFLSKPQKPLEKNPEVKINVSITKQESPIPLTKELRESVLTVANVKREGTLQNIPDCISVTPKVVSNERHKYEHVRKRALQEYRQQHQTQERLKPEEKKLKTEDNLLSEIEIKEEKLCDDKNFSMIFDSVIAKTSESVRQSESVSGHSKSDKYGMESLTAGGTGLPVKNPSAMGSQFKNNSAKLRDVRTPKDKYYANKSESGVGYAGEGSKYAEEMDERNENISEQRVQMEMDRVMQNLVELSREKNAEYDYESHHMTSGYSSNSLGLKAPNFQEPFQKMYK